MKVVRRRREKVPKLPCVNFDDYSNNYKKILDYSIRFSGEVGDYFYDYKVNCIKKWVCDPRVKNSILDFGCGTGRLSFLIAKLYSHSTVIGYDISSKSIDMAQRKWGTLKNLRFENHFSQKHNYDIITAANVFHHVKPKNRTETLKYLQALLKPEGKIVVFEHNPFNPLTLYAVKTCEVDTDAELIWLGRFVKLAADCGLKILMKRYIVFFPKILCCFRKFEPSLGFLPLGAQYMVVFSESAG